MVKLVRWKDWMDESVTLKLDLEVEQNEAGEHGITLVHRLGNDAYCPLLYISEEGWIGLFDIKHSGAKGFQLDDTGHIKVFPLIDADLPGLYRVNKLCPMV